MTPAILSELKRLDVAVELDPFNKTLNREYVDACVSAAPALLEAVETMLAALEKVQAATERMYSTGREQIVFQTVVQNIASEALARVQALLAPGKGE